MQSTSVDEPALLIRIAKLYDQRMTPEALYEATRGVWRVGDKRERVSYASAVAQGLVREVFAVMQWHPAGSTPYRTRPREDVRLAGRWEFTGAVAPDVVRDEYLGKSVAHYFSRGNSNPVLYVNVD